MQNRRLSIILLSATIIILLARQVHISGLKPAQAAKANALTGEQMEGIDQQEVPFQQIRALLVKTETGKMTLDLMGSYHVGIRFDQGSGTIYHVPSNTMVIDANQDPVLAAINLVHEMNHARYYHEGLRADAHAYDRDEFVRMKIAEEAQCVVLSIQVKTELWKAGVDVFVFNYPLEEAYYQAHMAAVEAAVAQEAGQDVDKLLAIGIEAGTARVVKGLMNGEVRRSSDQELYPDFFAKAWQEVHFSDPVSRVLNILAHSAVGF